ncbi:MAG: hypothetical protein AAGG44_00475 [Planctomycetota bacterium]
MSATKLIAAVVSLLLIIGVAVWFLGSGYGETSETGYQYAVALFRICNQKDLEALESVEASIETDAASGALGASETKWLEEIISMAKANQWSAASTEIRELMEDQVQYADVD